MDSKNKLDYTEDDPVVEIDPNQLELELDVPKTLRTEYNFIKFPFFDLTKDSGRDEIRIEETIQTKVRRDGYPLVCNTGCEEPVSRRF